MTNAVKQVVAYQTSDGKQFPSQVLAEHHQKNMDRSDFLGTELRSLLGPTADSGQFRNNLSILLQGKAEQFLTVLLRMQREGLMHDERLPSVVQDLLRGSRDV